MRDEALHLLRDSVYVTVGFGVLTVQRLQVRRRELERLVARQAAGSRDQVRRVLGQDGD